MDEQELEKRTKELRNVIRQERIRTSEENYSDRTGAGSNTSGDTGVGRAGENYDRLPTTQSSENDSSIYDVSRSSERVRTINRDANSVSKRSQTGNDGSGQGDRRSFQDRGALREGMDRLSIGDTGIGETGRRTEPERTVKSDATEQTIPPPYFQDFTEQGKEQRQTQKQSDKGAVSKENRSTSERVSFGTEKRGPGRPKKIIPIEEGRERVKQQTEKIKATAEEVKQVAGKISNPFKGAKKLTSHEAEELEEPLAQVFLDMGEQIDRYIWEQTKDPMKEPVFSDLSDMEAHVLSRILLRWGQRSPVAATAVHTMINANDYILAVEILVPRVGKARTRLVAVPRRKR